MINKNPYIFFVNLLVLSFGMGESLASCECKCEKGKPIPKCEDTVKIKPICLPRICGEIELNKFDKIYAPSIDSENKLLECSHKNVFNKKSQLIQRTELCE